MKVNPWYYNFRKIQPKIFSSFLKIALFAKTRVFTWQRWYAVNADRSMQPVIDGNCHFLLLFLSGEITMFQLVSFLPSGLYSYLHIAKITHSSYIIFLNMCKMKKIPLCWNMIPLFQQLDVFSFMVSSSLNSALASINCSGHQWLLSGLITIWKTGKIQ